MYILQFQFINTTDEEQDIIPQFCNWLCDIVYSEIDTKINRKKISIRLNYILDKVDWIHWNNNNKYNISVVDILNEIHSSIIFKQYKDNKWRIQTDVNRLIPYSTTAIDRLIRFINYGDNNMKGTGIITNLEKEYNHSRLLTLWNMFCMQELGTMSNVNIITK